MPLTPFQPPPSISSMLSVVLAGALPSWVDDPQLWESVGSPLAAPDDDQVTNQAHQTASPPLNTPDVSKSHANHHPT